jgi:hypothetical protein
MRPASPAFKTHRHGWVHALERGAARISRTTIVPTVTMDTKTSQQNPRRARRFALHLPVYFRPPQSPTWLEGTTENISYTGVLFRSPSPFVPETLLELRLQLPVGTKHESRASEIRCKGEVVRVEHRNAPETATALGVAIRDYHIVRRAMLKDGPVGTPKSTDAPPKSGRRPQ